MTNTKTDEPHKGSKGGECARTACNHRAAFHFNTSTREYYCEWCARLINAAAGENLCLPEAADERPHYVITVHTRHISFVSSGGPNGAEPGISGFDALLKVLAFVQRDGATLEILDAR